MNRGAASTTKPDSQKLHLRKTFESARLPAHAREDTGQIANTSGLHGDSGIVAAQATRATAERAVLAALEPSAFREVSPFPAQDLQPYVGMLRESESSGPDSNHRLRTGRQARAFVRVKNFSQPPSGRGLPSRVARHGPGRVATLDSTVVDQIRVEIRKRLIFFQACTDAARRRGAADVRRLLATWLIAADGTIKSIKLEGVEEEETTACLVRAGSRPFSVKPGMDVTIPTPIVFVR